MKNFLKFISQVICVCFVVSNVYSQKPYNFQPADPFLESWRWHHFAELEGRNVLTVEEDNEGNYWFGCQDLLIKYNGYKYENIPIPDSMKVGFANKIKSTNLGMVYGSYRGVSILEKGNKWRSVINTAQYDSENEKKIRLRTVEIEEINDSTIAVFLKTGILIIGKSDVHFYSSNSIIKTLKPYLPDIEFHTFGDKQIFETELIFIGAHKYNGHHVVYSKHQRTFFLKINGFQLTIDSIARTDIPIRVLSQNFISTKNKDDFWISNSANTTNLLHIRNGKTVQYNLGEQYDGQNATFDILPLDNDQYIVGSSGCFYTINNDVITRYKKPQIPLSPASDVRIVKDSKENFWFINSRNKVFRFEHKDDHWKTYNNLLFQFQEKDVNHPDRRVKKWFISKDNQLVYNTDNNWYYYDVSDGLMDHPLAIIKTRKGHYWCSGNHQGRAATAYYHNNKWHKQIHENMGWSFSKKGLYEDSEGNIWFGASMNIARKGAGVLKLNYASFDSLHWEHYATPIFTFSNFVEFNDALYAGFTLGVAKVKKESSLKAEISFTTACEALDVMPNGKMVLGTRSRGIIIINKDKSRHNYNIDSGLVSNMVIDIYATPENGIWVATESDISYFDGNGWTNHCFPEAFNLMPEAGRLHVTDDNRIWISQATTEWVRQNYNKQSDVVPDYGVIRSIRYISDTTPPQTYIDIAPDTVGQEGNVFISWYGIDYLEKTPQDKLMYSFKIDDEEWSPYSKKKNHTFLSLSRGKHTIQLRTKDSDFNIDKTPATFKFIVLPPIWMRPWFIAMVITFLLVTSLQWMRIVKRNRKLLLLNNKLGDLNYLLQEQKEEIVTKNEEIIRKTKEVHNAKLRFFTNISHEFKTPLTLIYSPVEKLLSKTEPTKEERFKLYTLIRKNVLQLLSLINDLIEFRKAESGISDLELQKCDINELVLEMASDFSEWAAQNEIHLKINVPDSKFEILIDIKKIQIILSNLLSNAIKYTPARKNIEISCVNDSGPITPSFKKSEKIGNLSDESCSIIIRDEGFGISEENLDKIFDRFYHTAGSGEENSNGAGIGLALTKSLILKHNGEIIVNSEKNKGSEFILRIPTTLKSTPDQAFDERIEIENNEYELFRPNDNNFQANADNAETINNVQTILIVEDNVDIRNFTASNLSDNYHVLEASNGKEGLKTLTQYSVDLVISDIMMPEMDGYEFCKQIKTNAIYSHIPIILLSAKNDIPDKIKGAELGADAYIDKPFSLVHLEATISNIFNNRNVLIEKFRSDIFAENSMLAKNTKDKDFLEKITQTIEQNLDDTTFRLEKLDQEIGMSRDVLNNKLKTITGQTSNEFVRSIRLKKAAQLISNGEEIPVVMIKVGISSRSYFNKIFKSEFNQSPSEFLKKS